MPEGEAFVIKLLSENALTASSISSSKVSSLGHKTRNDSVESRAFEVQVFPRKPDTLLAGAEGAEVRTGERESFLKQLHGDSPL